MISDVGDAVLVSTVVRDTSGSPVNTPTVVLTVTKPNASTSTPSVTNSGAGGVYTATFTLDQAGLWKLSWAASGTVTSVETDQLTAVTAGRVLVASFSEYKSRINRGDTVDDAELRTYLASATDWAEWAIGGPLSVQTFTELHWVDGTIVPRKRPIVAITSITPDQGTALSSSSYFATDTHTIEFRYGVTCGWHTLVYTAGLSAAAIVERERVKLAGLEVATHLWNAQNGSAGRGFPPDDLIPTPLGFAVPRRAIELLSPDRIPGIG